MAQSTSVKLKLLIDSNSERVLFAEAGKDFVDFLLTLLSLPVSTVIRLLSSTAMVGTLGKLYDSFQALSDTFVQPNVKKDTLLKPNSPIAGSVGIFSLQPEPSAESKRVFICQWPSSDFGYDSDGNICNNNNNECNEIHGSDSPDAVCPNCEEYISVEVPYVAPPIAKGSSSGGFVKGVVTYMIMDDLEVKPMSTISSIALLINKFNVVDVGSLQEKIVSLGINEGLSLLKASLQTKMVLTSVFLRKLE